MQKTRLEAFSDGVIAVAITLMVLEVKPPLAHGLSDLKALTPGFLSYVLSFVYVGIYWTNHHHLFQATQKVTGGILWANLFLLFWLTLFPFTSAWASQNFEASTPSAVYGVVLLMAAVAYLILQSSIIAQQGPQSVLGRAVGRDWKGRLSPTVYLLAIPLAYVSPWISDGLYVLAACAWLVPDRRIERELAR